MEPTEFRNRLEKLSSENGNGNYVRMRNLQCDSHCKMFIVSVLGTTGDWTMMDDFLEGKVEKIENPAFKGNCWYMTSDLNVQENCPNLHRQNVVGSKKCARVKIKNYINNNNSTIKMATSTLLRQEVQVQEVQVQEQVQVQEVQAQDCLNLQSLEVPGTVPHSWQRERQGCRGQE